HAHALAGLPPARGPAGPARLPAARTTLRPDPRSTRPPGRPGRSRDRLVDPRRVYSALVFFPLFYLLVRYLPPVAFSIFVATSILLAQYEYYRLHSPDRFSPPMGVGLLSGLLITAGFAVPGLIPEPATITFITMAILLSHVLSGRDLKSGLYDTAVVLFGVFYVAWLLGHLIRIDRLANGPFLIFFLFLVTWANDTAAYYVGTLLGRHPMAPLISPKKTWEGAVGGLIGSVAAAFACRAWFLDSLGLSETVWLGLMIGLAAPLGDLCESALKRSAGVKDSGGRIPGPAGPLGRRARCKGLKTTILNGTDGLMQAATLTEADLVISAIVGGAGLVPTLAAIKAGKFIALANKEPMVMAGRLMQEEARKRGVRIFPVDSEHSALFQSMEGHRVKDIRRLILTASGGPLWNLTKEQLRDVT